MGICRQRGFTLAEVLIVLVIIGVVAAITIPSLVAKTETQQHSVAAKKIYAELSQAAAKIQTPDNWVDIPTDETDNGLGIRDTLCSVLSCVKKGYVNNIWGEFGATNTLSIYRNYKGPAPAYTDIANGYGAAILKNGMFIGLGSTYINSRAYHQIYVDTNGGKGPNMLGMDVLVFDLKNIKGYYKVLPEGAPGTYTQSYKCSANSNTYSTSWSCTALILTNPDDMP